MRKFQEWMESQLYESHLQNLSKIKERAIIIRTQSRSRGLQKKLISFSRHQTCEPGQNRQKSRNYYSRTQLKEEQIVKQNINLANRLVTVPSVISKNKQIQSYKKFRSFVDKRNPTRKASHNRQTQLKNFFQLKTRNYVKGIHKNLMRIFIFSIPKAPEGNFNTFWLQLEFGTEKVLTQHYLEPELLLRELVIPTKNVLTGKKVYLTIHLSRKLEYINLGTYDISELVRQQNQNKKMTFFAIGNSRQIVELKLGSKQIEKHSSFSGQEFKEQN